MNRPESSAEYPEGMIRARLSLQRSAVASTRNPWGKSAKSSDAGFSLDLDIAFPDRGVTVVFGASGSGKTSLLRSLAGLEPGVTGRLSFAGTDWLSGKGQLPAHKRRIGYVFQESNLLPHLDVEHNLRFGMKRLARHGVAPPGAGEFSALLELLGIGGLLGRYPGELSGGERQRVALARALLLRPQMLLLDEPLASLDKARRQELLSYLERIKSDYSLPIVYVTHSVDELVRLGDHMLVLESGRCVASGPVLTTMSDLGFARELGDDAGSAFEGRVSEIASTWSQTRVAIHGGSLWLSDRGYQVGQTLRFRVLARDVSLSLSEQVDTSILNRLPATIEAIHPDRDQSMSLVSLRLGEPGKTGPAQALLARVSRRSVIELQLEPGLCVWAQLKAVAILS